MTLKGEATDLRSAEHKDDKIKHNDIDDDLYEPHDR